MAVDVVEVGRASADPDELSLLVLGGPTHAFGLSRPGTRRSAVDQAKRPVISAGIGLREWLDTVREGQRRCLAAAFDTRVRRPRLPGSAARAAGRRLRRRGYRLALPPASFYVEGTTGPLLPDELGRARRWGEHLAATVATAESIIPEER